MIRQARCHRGRCLPLRLTFRSGRIGERRVNPAEVVVGEPERRSDNYRKSKNMKVAIIGAGNMGMAFAKSFIQYELVKKENLFLIEKNAERAKALRQENAGVVIDTINAKIGEYDLIILSVKPQDFASLQDELCAVIQPNQLILSIMAGISIDKIKSSLNHNLIVRAMPNTPALLGMGMTAFFGSR